MVWIFVKSTFHMIMHKNSQFSVKLPLSNVQFSCLQEKDPKIQELQKKVQEGMYREYYFIQDDILYRSLMGQWS